MDDHSQFLGSRDSSSPCREVETQIELARQNERLQLLLKLSATIASKLNLRDLLREIAANIRIVMRCDGVGISMPDPETGRFRLHTLEFPNSRGLLSEGYSLPSDVTYLQTVMESLQPIVITSHSPEESGPELYEILVAEGVKSRCLIPLVNHGRPLGLLVIARTNDAPFTADDVSFLSQASGQISVAVENARAFEEISALKEKLAQEKLYLEEEIRSEGNFEQIIGSTVALRQVLGLVETVAPSDSTVLLLGETGTGKELIARAIHQNSRRANRTFIKLNCAAIPTGLLESELFGHEKGAFTGAISSKIGRLELADQGTLFLDEVGDIPLEIQPKLLRALQEQEFERLGSTQTKKVNVRLIAATNRNLEQMIEDRQFRSDLYYRLNVFPIRIPPLRERREDVPLLVNYFVQRFARQMQKKITSIPASAMKALTAWDWPGNIRELENFIERAVILSRGRTLEVPLEQLQKPGIRDTSEPKVERDGDNIARIVKETLRALHKEPVSSPADSQRSEEQRNEIIRALEECKGRVGGTDGAAARMGLNRTTLLSRMKKLGIDPRHYANPR